MCFLCHIVAMVHWMLNYIGMLHSRNTQDRRKGSWLLPTYLIPACVGRGVKLGSESSSGGGAGGAAGSVWKSGNLEIWEPGNLGIWRSLNLEIQNFEIKKTQKRKLSKSESVLPKMSARSGLVGTKILLAPFGAIWVQFFPWAEKMRNH